ncbi:DUF2069 domain-containing protein [Cellvibrio sp. pealriver]|uniref:DUF2069 domain-containing protein n=1 Tax=Cellvibrio sp. pealriver TaxID=1622269 RepID=UPI00066FEB42|nr:DUF2069 domain-containing protein [Cellvibrio sp. pealriver]
MTHTPEHDDQQLNEKSKKVIVITDEDAVLLQKKLRTGKAITLVSFGGLLVIFTLLNLTSEKSNFVFWLFQMFPLLIFIPLLRKPTHRTYSWLCFVSLMYFVGIIPLLMGSWSISYWLITLLVCSLFIGAMMTSRWLQYWNYYLSTKQA